MTALARIGEEAFWSFLVALVVAGPVGFLVAQVAYDVFGPLICWEVPVIYGPGTMTNCQIPEPDPYWTYIKWGVFSATVLLWPWVWVGVRKQP